MADLELQNDENRGRTLDNEHWSDVLIQAMPYFKQWVGKTVVVKYGVSIDAVADSLKEAVKYKVERFTGMIVNTVNVNVVLARCRVNI